MLKANSCSNSLSLPRNINNKNFLSTISISRLGFLVTVGSFSFFNAKNASETCSERKARGGLPFYAGVQLSQFSFPVFKDRKKHARK